MLPLPRLLHSSKLLIRSTGHVESAFPAIGSQRTAATVGGAVPDFDPTDVPHPDTRAPQGKDRGGWWMDPSVSTAQAAYDVFLASLQRHKVVRQRHVQEVIKRCSSPEDLMLAVQALERLRRHRASVLNHEPFNHNTSKAFAQKVVEVGAPKVAVDAFTRHNQLGLQPSSIQLEELLKSALGDVKTSVALLKAAKVAGIRITNDHAYTIARSAMISGVRQTGIKHVKQLEAEGVRIRPSVWKALKLGLGGSPLPKSEDASHSVAAATSSAGDDDNDNVDAESPAGGPAAEPAVGEEEGTVGGGAMPDAGEVGGMDDAAKAEATKPAADGATPGYAS